MKDDSTIPLQGTRQGTRTLSRSRSITSHSRSISNIKGFSKYGTVSTGFKTVKDFLSRKNIYSIILLAFSSLFLYADQNLMAPNLSAIASTLQLDEKQKEIDLGGKVMFGYFCVGGVVSLIFGPLADHMNRIKLLVAVILIGEVPSFFLYYCTSFNTFFWLRLCTGVSIGGSFPVLYSLISDLFPSTERNAALSFLAFVLGLGQGVGQVAAGLIGPAYGWQLPYIMNAMVSLICAGMIYYLVEDPPRRSLMIGTPMVGHTSPTPTSLSVSRALSWRKFRTVLKVRTNQLVLAQALCGCIPWSIISVFFIDFFHKQKNLSVQSATAVMTFFFVGCGLGNIAGGVLGQRLNNKNPKFVPIFMSICTSLSIIPLLYLVNAEIESQLIPSAANATTFGVAFLAGLLAMVTAPNVGAITMNVNEPENQGTVFSLYTIANEMGKGLGPIVVAYTISLIGRERALTICFLCFLLCATFLFAITFTVQQDQCPMEIFLPLHATIQKHSLSNFTLERSRSRSCSALFERFSDCGSCGSVHIESPNAAAFYV